MSSREGRWPSPREFVDEWEERTDDARLAMAERIIQDAQKASRCFVMNHDALASECEHLRTALATARADAIEEFAGEPRPHPTRDVRYLSSSEVQFVGWEVDPEETR